MIKKQNKRLVYALAITIVLFTIFALFSLKLGRSFTYDESWPGKNYGWPFVYSYTVDAGGLCIGFPNETGTDCGVRHFPKNNAHLAYDLVISLAAASLVGYLVYRHSKTK